MSTETLRTGPDAVFLDPRASVVIPACNEETAIRRCLTALLADAAPGELDVVVVCNGCTDGTAEAARAFPVRVLETPVGSKPTALNLGDRAALAFPRVYLDADVELSTQAVRAVVAPLRREAAQAAAPRLELDTADATSGVRAYHRVWARLPHIVDGLMGRGVYALSRQGRHRFAEFPDIIADDLFIDQLFPVPRGNVVRAGAARVRAAPTLRELLHRKTRVFAGNQQLADLQGPSLGHAERLRALLELVRHDLRLAPSAAVYLVVNAEAKRRARRRLRRHRVTWQGERPVREATGSKAAR